MKTDSENTADTLLVLGLTALAAWLRFAYCGQPSLWWDEFITLGASLRPLGESLAVLRNFGPSEIGVEMFPPLQHIITHGLLALGGGDVLLRLPGLLAGAATVPALYVLVRRPLGRLTAFSCATLLALSVYHIHYSRELRPYALFMLENILALHALHGALTQNRRRMLIGFGACVAAMLYTSYMASILVFAQALFAGGYLATRMPSAGKRREAVRTALWLALALGSAAAVYLPWAPAQALLYKALRDPSQSHAIPFSFLAGSLKEFAGFAYRGEFPAGWVLAGMGGAGFVAALARRSRAFPLMMVLWAAMPMAGILVAQTRMDLSSRYIFPVFLFLMVFAGHFLAVCVAFTGRLLFGSGPPIFAARAVAAAALCVLVNAANLESLSEYYSRESSGDKQLMAYLIENRNNMDLLLFAHPRQLKLIGEWYGGGVLPEARQISGPGYSRAFLVSPLTVDPAKLEGAVERARMGDAEIASVGLARAAVVPMAPDGTGAFSYAEDFSTLRFLEDVHESHNLAPSLEDKVLMPYDAGRPGWCEYVFRAPAGEGVGPARLRLDFSLFLTAGEDTDAVVRVGIARGAGAGATVAQVTGRDFKDAAGHLVPADKLGRRHVKLELDVTPLLAGTGECRLRFEFGPCLRGGAIEVSGFQLDAALDGPRPPRTWGPLQTLARLPVAPWTPGRALLLSNALYAFGTDGSVSAPRVGTPDDLARYKSLHPGEKPVRVLRYPDGAPAVALYDPALADPAIEVRPALGAMVEAFPPAPRGVRTLKLSGVLDDPVVALGQSQLPILVSSRSPAEFTVSDTGQAELTLSPLYTDGGFDADAAQEVSGLRKNPGEDCVACASGHPCSVTYEARFGYLVRSVRVLAFPRVVSEPGAGNEVRTLLSTDGKKWREINRYAGSGSGRWEGLKIPQYSFVELDKLTSRVLVRFELSGRDAQLWSAPDARMRLDFRLDGPVKLFGQAGEWPRRLGVANPTPLTVMLLGAPHVFPDWLKRTR